MPLFIRSYLSIPEKDHNKTLLQHGTPHRDHQLLGVGLMRSSLYRLPKQPEYEVIWLWDDPEFDPYDPIPSEVLVLDYVAQQLELEIERVQQDQQIRTKDHYLLGTDLPRQLGFLYQRSIEYGLTTPEQLYYAYMGAVWLDLALLGSITATSRKGLKPKYLPQLLESHGITPLSTHEEILSLHLAGDEQGIRSRVTTDLQSLSALAEKLMT